MHPAIGEKRKYRGQIYECVDAYEHTTKDGRQITLLTISSSCVDCGRMVAMSVTPYGFRRWNLNRRCGRCKRPGAPVGPVRRNRAPLEPWPVQKVMHRILIELAEEQSGRVSPDARGWVKAKDWINALIAQGIFEQADAHGRGPYYRARTGMKRRKMIEVRGPAVRALSSL
jgi:hypothetical protein